MLVPIACVSCGKQIGDIAPIFIAIRKERMLKMYKDNDYRVTPSNLMSDSLEVKNIMEDILKGLKVDMCCKTHIVTAMQYTDHY
jgi:DNA-directed RNA polymerase subunit N (RpoN/RPB10)